MKNEEQLFLGMRVMGTYLLINLYALLSRVIFHFVRNLLSNHGVLFPMFDPHLQSN